MKNGIQIFENAATKTATIDIDGYIGYNWFSDSENTKERLKKELKAIGNIKADTIVVNINSLGGDVNHGLSIHDLLAEHPAKIITKINGMTASAATIIALAGSERRMSDNALALIHLSSTGVYGNIANGTGLLYNNGSGAYTWVAGSLPPLTDGNIWIGNTMNAASERVLSGDATISNMGVVTVADDSHSHTSTTLPFPFARYRASDTLQVSSVVRSIKFDTESFDPTASYSVGSYEVTVPAIGYYEVQLQGMTQYGTQDPQEIEWYITVNGSAVSNSQNLQMTHFGSTRPITLTDIVYVSNASYKIGVKIKNTTNNSKYVVVKANPHLTIKKL